MEWIIRYRTSPTDRIRKAYATCPYQPSKDQARAYVPICDHGGVEIVSVQRSKH